MSDPYRVSEDQVQMALVDYLDVMKNPAGDAVLYYHVPNGGMRNKRVAAGLKRIGTKRGVSDLVIAEPVGIYHGLYLEVKTKGGRMSSEQKVFKADVIKRGYAGAVCYTVAQGVGLIDSYLAGEVIHV